MPGWITRYWVEWLFGLLIAGLTYVVRTLAKRVHQQQAENEALRNGMRSLLRAQIVEDCERCQADGWCGDGKRSTISDLYTSYHALGGNGPITDMVEQTRALPAFPPHG